ncbi:MAG: iron-sulfur cluster repair di-iron protein [Polyangiales bacterium]
MLDRSQTVANVVLDHSETASVFQKHRIDFCCKGDVSIADACASHGLDTAALLAELEETIASRQAIADDPRALSTPELVAHIVAHHHQYLRKALPFVQSLAVKVARVHGNHEPKLHELGAAVLELIMVLEPHLDQEEEVLFPQLMSRNGDRTKIAAELASMHEEHLAVGRLLTRIRDATSDFALPDWACNSYRTLFAELEALEGDVHAHVHLENHVLMPRYAS